ncbi:MAG: 3-deoxy-D-manno-octulosonic acid transferase, partial [Candidatus Zixiibacteriota bacterium]
IMTFIAYSVLYIVGRVKAARGSMLWRGRLGLIDSVGPKDLWMHAASVGEVKVLCYLLDYLNKRDPTLKVHITAMTEAGFKTASRELADKGDTVTISYFPFDAPPAIRRSLERINPRMLVIAETEIWPNLISHAAGRNIPIILINGRMSEKAFRAYRFVSASLGKLLAKYDRFFFKTDLDAQRYRHFGVTTEKTAVAGDMKFDAPLPARSEGRRREIRSRVGVTEDEFLFVAGSTRPGEEAILTDVFTAVHGEYKNFRMVIAPRHMDRLCEVKAVLAEKGLPFSIYGETHCADGIVIIDRMGILNDLYLAANLAFVGGTLVNIGGHNILEPVWAGTPVIFGPYLSNVSEAADYILSHNYGARIDSGDQLATLIKDVINSRVFFSVKTEGDLRTSPTAVVGDYILSRLRHV